MIAILGVFERSQRKKQSTETKTPVLMVDSIRYSIQVISPKCKFYFLPVAYLAASSS